MDVFLSVMAGVFAFAALIFELLLFARCVIRMFGIGESSVNPYLRMLTEPLIVPIRFILDRIFGVCRFSVDISYAVSCAAMVFLRYFFVGEI